MFLGSGLSPGSVLPETRSALGSSILKRAAHISARPSHFVTRGRVPVNRPNQSQHGNNLPTSESTSKGETKCQTKKVATHNIAIRRSPRTRNLETNRTSQYNRCRADSPKLRSRNKRNAIKIRENRPRLAVDLDR